MKRNSKKIWGTWDLDQLLGDQSDHFTSESQQLIDDKSSRDVLIF